MSTSPWKSIIVDKPSTRFSLFLLEKVFTCTVLSRFVHEIQYLLRMFAPVLHPHMPTPAYPPRPSLGSSSYSDTCKLNVLLSLTFHQPFATLLLFSSKIYFCHRSRSLTCLLHVVFAKCPLSSITGYDFLNGSFGLRSEFLPVIMSRPLSLLIPVDP